MGAPFEARDYRAQQQEILAESGAAISKRRVIGRSDPRAPGAAIETACAALHAQHTPDGRPLRYLPGER